MRSKAYGAAAVAIALDGLAVGHATPFLPFGSGLSLAAAGMILIFWPALGIVAARLSALIFAAWAIVLKAPPVVAEPASGSAWVGFLGLLVLAVIGSRLGSNRGVPEAAEVLPTASERWPRQDPSPVPLYPYQGSNG